MRSIPSNIGSSNMTPWILALLIIPAFRFFSKEKPLYSSYGILKYADPYFKSWSERLMRVTILEKNWLTSSKEKCSSALDPVIGSCLHINNMENDAATLQNLANLTPFHLFCYTLVRRCLEIVSLYLVRWLPLSSLFGFLASGCFLVWIYFKKKWKPKKAKTATKGVLECLIAMPSLLILLTFLFSATICLSIIVPFTKELVSGGASGNQFLVFFKDLNKSLMEKMFFQNNSCSTVYDLFYFRCLRKALFDLEKSRMTPSVPLNTEERLLLKMQSSVLNTTLLLLSGLMHLTVMLFICMMCRMTIRYLETIVAAAITEPLRKMKRKLRLWDHITSLRNETLEHCYKKVLKPGFKNPWRELDFTTRIVPSNRRRIAQNRNNSRWLDEIPVVLLGPSVQFPDNQNPSEERQSNPDSSRPVIGKVKNTPPCRNSSRMSVTKAEGMKPSVKSSDPSIGNSKEAQSCSNPSKVSVTTSEAMKPSLKSTEFHVYMVKEPQAIRNSSKVSVAKAEAMKPSVKSSDPSICQDKEAQPVRNPSKVSAMKPSVKWSDPGLPSVNGQQKTPIEHADVGTYVCFDPEGSSEESDFEFVDF